MYLVSCYIFYIQLKIIEYRYWGWGLAVWPLLKIHQAIASLLLLLLYYYCYRRLQNNARSKTTRYDSQTPFPHKSMLTKRQMGLDRRAKTHDFVMILPSRTGVYFAKIA